MLQKLLWCFSAEINKITYRLYTQEVGCYTKEIYSLNSPYFLLIACLIVVQSLLTQLRLLSMLDESFQSVPAAGSNTCALQCQILTLIVIGKVGNCLASRRCLSK